MSRGTKLSLDLGASWNEGWSVEKEEKEPTTLLAPSAHKLVFQKEKRKGKPVTLVGPFSLSDTEAQKVLSSLKKTLACGGSYKDAWMEFQGDIASKVRERLEKLGYKFKTPR